MLQRAGSVHGYATRSARVGIALTARDHQMVGYRVPREWATLTEGFLGAFKRRSKAGFLAEYGAFVCGVRNCGVCMSGV